MSPGRSCAETRRTGVYHGNCEGTICEGTTGVKALQALALLILMCPVPLWATSLPDIIDGIRPSVVGVGTAYPPRQPVRDRSPNRLIGTGFVVGDGRTIVTNKHVIPDQLDRDNQQTLAIFAGRGAQAMVHPATVLAEDPIHDLALLRITSGPLPTVRLGDSDRVREGSAIAFTGYPIGAVLGLYPATHTGIVSSITPVAHSAESGGQLSAAQIRRMRNPYDVFQLDATAYPGNSGSPVYEIANGQVIGVVNSVFVKESREAVLERPSGITYAIPVVHVRELLRTAGLEP